MRKVRNFSYLGFLNLSGLLGTITGNSDFYALHGLFGFFGFIGFNGKRKTSDRKIHDHYQRRVFWAQRINRVIEHSVYIFNRLEER